MLAELAVSDLGVIDRLSLVLRPGHDRAHRRDRRGQDDGGRAPSGSWPATGPTPRWCAPVPTEATVEGRFVDGRRGDGAHPGRAPARAGRAPTATAASSPPPTWPSWPPPSSTSTASTPTWGCSPRPGSAGPSTGSPAIDLGPARGGPGRRSAPPSAPWRSWAATPPPATASSTSSGSSSTRSRPAGSPMPDEDDRLAAEEALLGDADAHRAAAEAAGDALGTERRRPRPASRAPWPRSATARPFDGGREPAPSRAGRAGGPGPRPAGRSRGRSTRIPERLAAVQARRAELADLRRRYAGGARSTAGRAVRGARRARRPRRPSWRPTPSGRRPPKPTWRPARAAGRRPAAVVAKRRRRQAPVLAKAVAGRARRAGPAQGRRRRSRSGAVDPGDDVAFLLAAQPRPARRPAGQGRLRRRAGPHDAGPAAGGRAPRCPRWCSTRSTPASAAPPPARWAEPWPRWPRTGRCWWSPTCPRWRPSPTPRSRSTKSDDGRTTVGARPSPSMRRTRVEELARMLSGLAGERVGAGARRGAARHRRRGARPMMRLRRRTPGHRRGRGRAAGPRSAGAPRTSSSASSRATSR